MISPVRCNFCGERYDLGEVTVIHRYADCSVFKTPCCNKTADDREWKSLPDFKRMNENEPNFKMLPNGEVIYYNEKIY